MATWETLRSYVHSNYKIAEEDSGFMKLIFAMDNDRSQMVLIPPRFVTRRSRGLGHDRVALSAYRSDRPRSGPP